ncbi:MAG: hypothetical protein KAY65_12980 [Planctomycetes bacterium]|nr:hypothetical protein [Planctomycetota bacterium]
MKKTGYKTAILIVLAVLALGGHALAPRGGPAAGPRGGPAPELRCGAVAGQGYRKLYGKSQLSAAYFTVYYSPEILKG